MSINNADNSSKVLTYGYKHALKFIIYLILFYLAFSVLAGFALYVMESGKLADFATLRLTLFFSVLLAHVTTMRKAALVLHISRENFLISLAFVLLSTFTFVIFLLLTLLMNNPVENIKLASISQVTNKGEMLFLLFLTSVVVPVYEEIISRFHLVNVLRKLVNSNFFVVIVSSAFFALLHTQYQGLGLFLPFCFGVLFCIARIVTGSIVPGIFMHGIANAIWFFHENLILIR
ncbi:CPBP family intramembrane metalloprotease [Rheinheimera sp. UJ51]|uniref:CPBP family intramembrane glutamic endopeptidase n=1 Tax=Rheinheimera sp. UJ51 TaxID=2892446 RepID=UPI001E2E97F6|nr:type II CAAX endopeptidase family protein [Rheinheimera sp. UJ51]MCC5452228.1 CPBP family intramembrane metalloprotease [Rheinheimera sp. UJ51]